VKPNPASHSSSFSRTAARKTIAARPRRTFRAPQRECIALSDATDCLLEAYDVICRRAYEHFLDRGPRTGDELQDWVRAERDLLLDFPIHLKESDEFVYALASLPGARAARLEVGIESRWLVILAHHGGDDRSDAASPENRAGESRPHERRREVRPRENRSSLLGATESRNEDASPENRSPASHPARSPGPAPDSDVDRPPKSICILELPAEVSAARSIAVLADGLLAIRMPKITEARNSKIESRK
jgi:HSP20 family molecular chaperone IbpA